MTDHMQAEHESAQEWLANHPYTPPVSTPTQIIPITETAPVNPTDAIAGDPNMLREFFAYVANKVTSASDLAERVKGLEEKIAALESEAGHWEQKHREEVAAHEETKRNLEVAQHAAHDAQGYAKLVEEEVASIRQERDTARGDCERLIRERDDWSRQYNTASADLSHAETEVVTLREQLARSEAKIANMIRALQA